MWVLSINDRLCDSVAATVSTAVTIRGLAVLLDRPFCAASGNELLVMFNDLGGVSGGVPAGGVEVIGAGELGSDVYRQSVADRVCQKDASEVMRTER